MPYKDPKKQLEYQNIWLTKRRKEYFDNKSCVDCSSNCELQLDHLDPSLKISHRIWSWSKDRRHKELEKCVVRCANCHRKRHADIVRASCGTTSAYRRGCRCRACKDAAVMAVTEWKKRKLDEKVYSMIGYNLEI